MELYCTITLITLWITSVSTMMLVSLHVDKLGFYDKMNIIEVIILTVFAPVVALMALIYLVRRLK